MKSYRIINAVMAVVMVALALNFSACSEDNDTQATGVVLEAFGPSPTLRGGKLTFVGKNLDRVTKVIFPDNIETTDIEVVSSGQIKVLVPQDAREGYVKLVSAQGEITTKTLLTYTEPIALESFLPSPIKAGAKLTLTGDYLNLIQKVVFAENVEVKCENFTTWERKKIELILPAEAQTGKIILADTAAIPLELESAEVLQVVLPSVDATLDLTGKKPGEVITVPGHDLDLVTAVQLLDGSVVEFTLDITENDTLLVFTLPENVTDGAIVMIPASGVRVAIANIGVAAPEVSGVSPATDLKGGDVITITGINMELVTTVLFPGISDTVTPASKNATQITVSMPALAKSGNLLLNTASGKTATVAIETLKPDVVTYSSNTVSAGEEVELQGHNLNLVASVTFGGGKKVDVTPAAADKLTVRVPTDAETGEVTLTMANGETVTCASLTVDKPVVAYIPVMPESEIKGGEVFLVEIENADKLTGVQINGQNVQHVLTGKKLYIGIPGNAYGNCTLKLVSSNGEISYGINVKAGGTVETPIWENGPLEITWSDDGRVMIPITAFDNVAAGVYLKFYFRQTENWGQVQINNGNWALIPFVELGNDGYLKTDGPMINNDKTITSVEVKLTADVLNNIRTNSDGTWGIIIQGSDWIFTKVTLVTKAKIATTIWSGSQELPSGWGSSLQLERALFENVNAGDVMKLTFSHQGSNGQLQFKNNNWTTITGVVNEYLDSSWDGMNIPDEATHQQQ